MYICMYTYIYLYVCMCVCKNGYMYIFENTSVPPRCSRAKKIRLPKVPVPRPVRF